LSTTRATIDVAARIIKLNISRKEETSTFKPKGTKKVPPSHGHDQTGEECYDTR
jgi:hypothetical protein